MFSDDREEPDFLVTEGAESFGLEITLAFEDLTASGQSRQRQREAFNAKRLHNLYRSWSDQSDTILTVQVLGHLDDSNQHEVTQALTESGMADRSVADPLLRMETPSGTRVFARVAFHPRWSQVDDGVGWVTQDAVAQAQAAIARKSSRLPSYRAAVGDDIRLLIVADHSRSSGMLELESVDAIDLAGFSAAYFLTFPGGPIREIRAKPPSA
ncbi:hypothetical protein [Brevundimonas sp.]|uniref:hypothetical protein n=1 Tax=Brevundimonas sp. TaxID=1871086 RepID=UPI002737C77D|nr:hypothetical protein [Brevundimonas sp.]